MILRAILFHHCNFGCRPSQGRCERITDDSHSQAIMHETTHKTIVNRRPQDGPDSFTWVDEVDGRLQVN